MIVEFPMRIFQRCEHTYAPEREREWKVLGRNRFSLDCDFRILHLVNEGPGTSSSRTHVTANHQFQARAIATHLARHTELCLLGAYHTHPLNCPNPSGRDRRTALDFVLERDGISGWDLDQFLVLIGTQLNHEFKIRACVISKDHQEFVEIPVVVSDPISQGSQGNGQ